MLGQFSTITSHIKWKPSAISIDNGFFALHYRFTLMLLLAWTIIECGTQYIGEHIRCISDKAFENLANVINSYCFFMTTYTSQERNNSAFLKSHLGIGPVDLKNENSSLRHHTYYQWVPFVLFFQALSFCITRRIWKKFENGTLEALSNGLNKYAYETSTSDKINNIKLAVFYEDDSETNNKIQKVKLAIMDRLKLNSTWAFQLIFCEILNVVNVVLQIYLTDLFLQGGFFQMGKVIAAGNDPEANNILETIFPKMTKCVFRKYGPGGSLQTHDIMCIMALNIVNEKVFLCMWVWYWFLLTASLFAVLWRLGTYLTYIYMKNFNGYLFRSLGIYLDPMTTKCLASNLTFYNWLFIYYLISNLMPKAANELIKQLVEDIQQNQEQNKERMEKPDHDLLLIKNEHSE